MKSHAPAFTPRQGGATPHAHPLRHYAAALGVPLRTVADWCARGRKATPPATPPLDDPERLADWWRRVSRQRVPVRLLKLERSAVGPVGEGDAGAGGDGAEPVGGFAAALARLRIAEANTGDLYLALAAAAARERNPPRRRERFAKAEGARRAWFEMADRLREYERDAEKIATASGRTWQADDVLASLGQIHGSIAAGLRQLGGRVRPALTAEQMQSHSTELERLLSGLCACKFAPPLPPP